MRKFLLTIKYHGGHFVGWQVQPNGVSVQQCLQDALEVLLGHRPGVTGCSRTDSGVHALGFCAVFESDTDKTCDRILTGLNGILPDFVSVWECQEVSLDFHPRYDAKGKEYVYRLYDGAAPDPFLKGLAWHVKSELNTALMQQAAKRMVGAHDFRCFMSQGSSIVDTHREIYWLKVERRDRYVDVSVCGDGFLYNMVRIVVGTLVAVSSGKIAVEDIDFIISSKDRKNAGQTAPAQGLYLNRVFYHHPMQDKEKGNE